MKGINENRIFLAIILAAFITGGFYYLSSVQTCEPAYPPVGDLETKFVTRVIDGDTVVIEGGESVRLLGIDADERGDPCYAAAKDRLEELILNKEVMLEMGVEDKDIYDRYLRYIILDGENINLRLVEEGLAIARFYSDVKYRDDIVSAEKTAMDNKTGCKWGDG